MNAIPFSKIDHVQLAAPAGSEDEARRFYGEVLGMQEIEKPPLLAKRGGVWFASGDVQIHIGIEQDFRPARKAHPALRCCDYGGLLRTLAAVGIEVQEVNDIPGVCRAHVNDPFGNRIELVAEPVM
ncbi:MAG TPA: VOC family protein [Terriglobales bacterium]|nr:VOC family protein [Terriglobales bacterium]